MLNIIKSDLYRIFRGKAIYISCIIILAMMLLSCFELAPGWIGMSNNMMSSPYNLELSPEDEEKLGEVNSIKEERALLKKYPYQLDKNIVGANANLYYISIIIVVIVISTDFSNNTIKNTISSAISRKKYYIAKLATIILLTTGLTLLNNYGLYFMNIAINGKAFSSGLGEITKITLYQLPLIYGIISLLVCISTVTRKTSIFNTISIPLIIGFQLILEGIITLFKLKPDILQWEYQIALSQLAANPANSYIIKCAILGLAYIVIFNTIGYKTFKRAEIK